MAQSVLFPSVLTHAPGKALFAASARKVGVSLKPLTRHGDLRYGGTYKILGTTKVTGTPDVPVARRVRLYNYSSAAALVKERWSNPDGSYEFRAVAKGPWFVVAHDHTGEFNAVIADNILATPM